VRDRIITGTPTGLVVPAVAAVVTALGRHPAAPLGATRRGIRGQLTPGRFRTIVAAVVLVVLGAGAQVAQAASTSPPVRVFPAAGDVAPPATAITDPGESDATCSGWYRQGSYVGQSTGSVWWEYYCHRVWPAEGTGATNADHGGQDIFDDYFYWDGSAAVAYGYWAYYGYWDSMIDALDCSYWGDEPSGLSYGPMDESFAPIDCGGASANAAPTASFASSCAGSRCSFDASASSDSDGSVTSYAWDYGDGTTGDGQTSSHTYARLGSYTVTLVVTDDQGASASTPQTLSVMAPSNAPPSAASTFSCAGLRCAFDSGGSADSDGTITRYGWDFGDDTSGAGTSASHTYQHAATYTVSLTVTDNAGASASTSKTAAPITLTARATRLAGLRLVALAWTPASGASADVYRNGSQIATVNSTSYTDQIDHKGSGAYTYRVCAAAFASCSDPVTVSP
jgi:PKD repeat protein